jgi:hypothetical protein
LGRQADLYRKWKRSREQLEEVFRSPAILLSMNTGLRRGETLKLRPGLATLGISTLDGEKPSVEVHGTPELVCLMSSDFQTAWETVLKRAQDQ